MFGLNLNVLFIINLKEFRRLCSEFHKKKHLQELFELHYNTLIKCFFTFIDYGHYIITYKYIIGTTRKNKNEFI